jgi:hypothetical protein
MQEWYTRDEKKFLEGIGTYNSNNSRIKFTTKEKLLEGYIEGCQKRVDWGDIDKVEIIEFAKVQLAELKNTCEVPRQ